MKRLSTKIICITLATLVVGSAGAQITITDKKEDEAKNEISIVPRDDERDASESIKPITESKEGVIVNNRPEIDTETLRRRQDPGTDKAIMILDASGSMWGQINEVTKIEIARDVVGEVLGNWGETTDLGLVAYGHREKGECADIETLIKPAKLDANQFTAVVGRLKPKGKTPLTQAVINAAEELKYSENKATVILISDGEETCGLDPCEAGKSLEELGVDFTAHVISFDVPEEKVAGMRCMAESTGGRFLQASDAKELKDALEKAVVVTTDKEQVNEAPATVSVSGSVIAGARFDVQWAGPKNQSDRLVIRDQKDKKSYGYSYVGDEDKNSPTELTAPETPGQYVVHYQTRDKKSLGKGVLDVVPAKATVSGPESVVAGSAFDVAWTGPKNNLDSLIIISTDGKKRYGHAYVYRDNQMSPSEISAPEEPGDYQLTYMTYGKNILARIPLRVVAADATVSVPESVVAGSVFDVAWTGPKNNLDSLVIISTDGKKRFGHTYVYRDNQMSPSEISAPEEAGDYQLTYMTYGKKILASANLSVLKAEASVSGPDTVVAGAKFDVEWTGPSNNLDRLMVFSIDGKKKYGHTYIYRENDKSPSEVKAPETPGEYEVRYYTNGNKTLASTKITVVDAEAMVSSPVTVVAGAKFDVEWTGPRNEFDTLTVFSADGKKKYGHVYAYRENDVSPSELKAPEVPGEYQVRYFTTGKKTLASAKFTVVSASATVSAPERVIAGAKLDVAWTGPRNEFDTLTIFSADGKKKHGYVYAYRENDLSPSELTAPEKPGEYEVRYFTTGKKTLAKDTFSVVAASATVSVPKSVIAGSKFDAQWTGPRNDGDHIAVFSVGGKKKHNYAYAYRDNDHSPSELVAPEKAGPYEVRYFTRGKNTLANTSFVVLEATATISAPKSVTAGAKFDVAWTGPKNQGDLIIIVSADGKKRHDYKYVYRDSDESPTEFKAPANPGLYEVRYFTRGKNTLSRAQLVVSNAQ